MTWTTFTEAGGEAGEIPSSAQLLPGTAAPGPPEGEFRVFKRLLLFLPEFYCLLNRLSDGIKTKLLLLKTEPKMTKTVSRRDWDTSLGIFSHTHQYRRQP